MFCIHQILKKKWEYNEAVQQFIIEFKKAYDSVSREVLCNIFIKFGIPMKLVKLIKMCLTEMFSLVCAGKNFSDMFPIRNGLKKGDALSSLLFNFVLECVLGRVQENQDGLKLNVTHQRLVYADDINILGGSICTIHKNTRASLVASKETGLDINADKTKYMVMS